MLKYNVQVGPDDFDGLQCDLDHEDQPEPPEKLSFPRRPEIPDPRDDNVRPLVVKTFLVLIVCALAMATGISLASTNWTPLHSVWVVVAAPLGALFNKYIGRIDG